MSWSIINFRSAKSEHSASILMMSVPSALAETTTSPSLMKSIASTSMSSKSSLTSGVRKAEALTTVSLDTLNHVNVALRKRCTTESLIGRPVPLRNATAMSAAICPD